MVNIRVQYSLNTLTIPLGQMASNEVARSKNIKFPKGSHACRKGGLPLYLHL